MQLQTQFKVIIPARYGSQRLPGKPLADIAGKTMVQRVYECAKNSAANEVIVATDDERIFEIVESFGGQVCMTSENHASGTDRLQEVVAKLGYADDEIVVNLQGDEPLMPPEVINQVAQNLAEHHDADASTLAEEISDPSQLFDENVVKVVCDIRGIALYFSRAPIPWERRKYQDQNHYSVLPKTNLVNRHIGIYGYRVKLLNQFVTWEESPIENLEKLEQLRILYNGCRIHVAQACQDVPPGVDTQEDLDSIIKRFS